MSINRKELFNELFRQFLDINSDVEAVIVSDKQGLVIAGDKRTDVDMEIVSVLTSIINPIIERIRDELFKIIESQNAADGLLLCRETGLLWEILPELDVCFKVEQKSPKSTKFKKLKESLAH